MVSPGGPAMEKTASESCLLFPVPQPRLIHAEPWAANNCFQRRKPVLVRIAFHLFLKRRSRRKKRRKDRCIIVHFLPGLFLSLTHWSERPEWNTRWTLCSYSHGSVWDTTRHAFPAHPEPSLASTPCHVLPGLLSSALILGLHSPGHLQPIITYQVVILLCPVGTEMEDNTQVKRWYPIECFPAALTASLTVSDEKA